MTSVAVVAHRRKQLGGGLGRAARACSPRRDSTRRCGSRWTRAGRHRSGRGRRSSRARIGCWSGAATAWSSGASTCSREAARRSASCRPAPRTSSRRTSASRRTSSRRSRSRCTAPRARSTSACINGERFAVMAGTGLDAEMIKEADRGLKDRMGKAAYVWTGVKAAGIAAATRPHPGRRTQVVRRPGAAASCSPTSARSGAGVTAFEDAEPDDGVLDVGVVTASTPWQWARVAALMLAGRPTRSKFVAGHPRPRGRRPAEPQGAVRAGRRRPQARQAAPGARRTCRDHRLRPGARHEHRARSYPRPGSSTATTPRRTLVRDRPPPAPGRRVPAPARRRRLQPRPVARVHDVARAGPGAHRARSGFASLLGQDGPERGHRPHDPGRRARARRAGADPGGRAGAGQRQQRPRRGADVRPRRRARRRARPRWASSSAR